MTGIDWYKEVTQQGGAPAPEAAPPRPETQAILDTPMGNIDWYAEVTGKPSQELRAAPFKGKPIADTVEQAAPASTIARASLAPEIDTQIKRFAAARFPDMPIDQAIKRYGVVDGNIVYADKDGNYVREIPSVGTGGGVMDTLKRAGKWVAGMAGPGIPQGASIAAGVAGGPGAASVVKAGMAGGGGQLIREGLDKLLSPDESMADLANIDTAGRVLGEGAMSAGGQALGVGAARLFTKNPLGVNAIDKTKALDPAKQAEIAALEAEAKKRGIDLSAGQATGLRSLLMKERQLGRDPVTTDRMADFAKTQRETQVPAAVRDEISQISPKGGEEAIQAFRQGAADVVKGAKKELSDEARKVYSVALDNRTPYWDDQLAELFKRPQMQQAWKDAQTNAANKGVTLPKIFDFDEAGAIKFTDKAAPDWRAWDEVKRALDDTINANKNEYGKTNGAGLSAQKIKTEMLAVLDKVNPDYKLARVRYGEAADGADAVLEGGVGFLDSIKGMDRQNIVNRVFSGQNMMPPEIRRMRGLYEKAGKLDDWNAGLSTFLSDKLAAAMVDAGPSMGNVPSKFYKSVWGDQRQQDVVRAALGDKDRVLGMERLMEVLRAASKSLPEGSPTATDMAADSASSVGTGIKLAGKLASPWTYANLGNEAVAGIEALNKRPEARIKLAEALLSGDYDKQLRSLRLLSRNQERAAPVLAQILSRAGISALGMGLGIGPADRAPAEAGPLSEP